MWDDWRLNIFRCIKENRLKMEANKIARRKCWETGEALEKCTLDKGMTKIYFCRTQLDAFLACCYHEQQVEVDKLRRDVKQHSEWYWLNIYDENGEIGRQAEWEPETQLTKIWGTFLYHLFYKPENGAKLMTHEQRQARLEELRKMQGCDIDALKEEFELDFHIDEEKAFKLGGSVIDKQIYNV